jgi:hypothetical protein
MRVDGRTEFQKRRDELTQERVRELFHYDPLTGVLTVSQNRGTAKAGDVAGFIDHQGYRMIKIDQVRYLSGRLIWFYVTGRWPEEVDHKNLNRSDDRWDNLREATRSQNCANKGQFYKKNKFGLRGVKQQSKYKFAAVIAVGQEEIYLGSFSTAAEAAIVYDEAARKYHGEFARFNYSGAKRDWLFV